MEQTTLAAKAEYRATIAGERDMALVQGGQAVGIIAGFVRCVADINQGLCHHADDHREHLVAAQSDDFQVTLQAPPKFGQTLGIFHHTRTFVAVAHSAPVRQCA